MKKYKYNHPKLGEINLKEVSRSFCHKTNQEFINCEVEGCADRLIQIKGSIIKNLEVN